MFTVNDSWMLPVNIAVILLVAFHIYHGGKIGFFRKIVSMFGTVISFAGAWFFSPVFADLIRIVPLDRIVLEYGQFNQLIMNFLNQFLWFLALFILLRFIFFLIGMAAKGLQELPFIHFLSVVLGGILGFLEGILWVLILGMVLSSPVFAGGGTLVNETLPGMVRHVTSSLTDEYIAPFLETESFAQLYEDASKLTEEQKQMLREWLEQNGYEQIDLPGASGD
ncbi:MAG: CvpA family protein [Solobacterium sp.]|nr:CvpA family protein [Solobacterium sp.]